MATNPVEVEPEPGERCSCGRPAVLTYVTSAGSRVPWCGVELSPDEAAALEAAEPAEG